MPWSFAQARIAVLRWRLDDVRTERRLSPPSDLPGVLDEWAELPTELRRVLLA
jgi:hypothetical protein